MNALLEAARDALDWLEQAGLEGCLIGGLAVQRWGEPRLTQDVDLTVLAALGSEERVVDLLLGRFPARRDDARAFALRYRVVLVQSHEGVPLDLALGATHFEVETVRRATPYEFEPGCVLRTCSAEDLIVHKVIAGRPRDIADLDGILRRQRGRLDLRRVHRWLTRFSEIEGVPDFDGRFEDILHGATRPVGRRPPPRRRRR